MESFGGVASSGSAVNSCSRSEGKAMFEDQLKLVTVSGCWVFVGYYFAFAILILKIYCGCSFLLVADECSETTLEQISKHIDGILVEVEVEDMGLGKRGTVEVVAFISQ
ncbi:hypothetical protein SO802_015066 [Lithocarpus litseifolius]|uniref:Uncharacterized protein n=1 Tax=Lithocarpus litseifolius TaxID=425828 RepID=A0AAW2CWT0_9ROSI